MVRESLATLFYKLGLLGNLGRMNGLLSCEVCFFRVLRHKMDSSAMSNPNGLLSQKVCHYVNQGGTLNSLL